ncbi:MAG: putative DNA modification/repair radical SAM protein [Lachnospiraceae bacterium]|nr:putative DNA modification/repair radical SAM protein [Lachnospiraceae bacterium]
MERSYTLDEKLAILSDAAKYDVACTSSGVDRKGKHGHLGSSISAGICHSFGADGRCITLLKILMTNECVFDCKYCHNRASNDVPRATFTPEEICTLTMEFYRRNYIEGLFLSSGVRKNPTSTMEQMFQALYLLRVKYGFRGYIHVKGVPGADPQVIREIGYLADRMSVNLELPTGDGLRLLAPHKTRKTILTPMRQIQQGIAQERLRVGVGEKMERAYRMKELPGSIFNENNLRLQKRTDEAILQLDGSGGTETSRKKFGESVDLCPDNRVSMSGRLDAGSEAGGCRADGLASASAGGLVPWAEDRGLSYVPAGQSTQMIIGATGETDYQIMRVAESLYRQFDLKRVFFSGYIPVNEDSALPGLDTPVPFLREHRLYQADWLLRFYGFQADELLSEDRPDFNVLVDPKCDWALRHLEYFPVEVNRADYALLLRVPGVGVKSARRIVEARRNGRLDFPDLKRIGVVLKRAAYFLTCNGRQMYPIAIEEDVLTRCLTADEGKKRWEVEHPQTYRQLSLFDDMHLAMMPTVEDCSKAAFGQF